MASRWVVLFVAVACAVSTYNATPPRQLASPVLDYPKLCPEKTMAHEQEWDTAYFQHDCMLQPTDNTARNGAQEINLVIISPYSGSLGDVMSMAEPLLADGAQEIEDSAFLPGYRVKFHLADSRCSAPDATAMTIRALSEGPVKHGVIGDSCSGCCVAENDALQYFNILQISANCISTGLSDRTRHPYFVRVVPSFRYNVLAAHGLFKQFGWMRIGLIHGWRSINILAKDFFVDITEQEVLAGTWAWTILMEEKVGAPADAGPAMDVVKMRDSRITFLALYEDLGSQVLCAMAKRGMSSPNYIMIAVAGWWNQGFITVRAPETACSAVEMDKAGYGTIAVDRGGMLSTADTHSLSGRVLSDIVDGYLQKCGALFNGQGACTVQWTGYFYDAMWHFAKILHQYLIDEGGDFATLASPSARQRLYELSLSLDYMGLTGRVRQFNDVDPVTDALDGSFGDREGNMLLRQIVNESPNEFNKMAYWSEDGTLWKEDVLWSMEDASKLVSCNDQTGCDMESAWIPRDSDDMGCPTGAVFSVELGCEPCQAGKFAPPGARQCTECDAGKFGGKPGLSACKDCPQGTATKALSAPRCVDCEAGSYSDVEGASACTWCTRGTYSADEGATSCNVCDGDLTTVNIASRTLAECTCKEGWYTSKEGVCEQCGEGLECAAGSQEEDIGKEGAVYPMVVAGYYTQASSPMSVYLCKSPEMCPGGLPESCPHNREGLACGSCDSGYYEDGELCVLCPPIFAARAVFPILAVLLAPPAIVLAFAMMVHGDTETWYKPHHALTVILFVALNYTQIVALHGTLQLQLPQLWSDVTLGASFLINPINIVRPECNDFRGFSSGYVARMCLPIFCLAIIGVSVVYGKLVKATCMKNFDVDHARSVLVSWYGSLFVALYLSISSQALSLFMCYAHPNGKTSLRSKPEVLCNESEWSSMVGVTILAILVYCVLSLVSIIFLVLVSAKYYNSKVYRMSTAFIFKRFRVGCGYWVIVLIVKGLWVSMSSVAFVDVDGQIMWLNAGVIAYASACIAVAPFRHSSVNLVDIGGHLMIAYVYNGSTFFAEVTKEVRDRMGLVNPVLACVFYFAFVVAFIYQLCLVFGDPQADANNDVVLAEAACKACAVVGSQPERTRELLRHLAATERGMLQKVVHFYARETAEVSIKAAGHKRILQRSAEPGKLSIGAAVKYTSTEAAGSSAVPSQDSSQLRDVQVRDGNAKVMSHEKMPFREMVAAASADESRLQLARMAQRDRSPAAPKANHRKRVTDRF